MSTLNTRKSMDEDFDWELLQLLYNDEDCLGAGLRVRREERAQAPSSSSGDGGGAIIIEGQQEGYTGEALLFTTTTS